MLVLSRVISPDGCISNVLLAVVTRMSSVIAIITWDGEERSSPTQCPPPPCSLPLFSLYPASEIHFLVIIMTKCVSLSRKSWFSADLTVKSDGGIIHTQAPTQKRFLSWALLDGSINLRWKVEHVSVSNTMCSIMQEDCCPSTFLLIYHSRCTAIQVCLYLHVHRTPRLRPHL